MNIKRVVIALLVSAAVIAGIIAAVRVLYPAMRGQGGYIVSVSPDGNVVVSRTDNNARGGPFRLRGNVAPGTYTLGSADDARGIYTVRFFDTTRLPGRFTLAIAGSTLDIMEARIIVDEEEKQWQR